ncbi:MAG: QueT transporter family protein [Bacillota bacterium]
MSKSRKISISAIVIAMYIAVMAATQSFAFGQYQIRVATSIYSLAAIHPFLILPLGIANFLSNTLMGGLGLLDMVGGFVVGVFTSAGCYYARKLGNYMVFFPIFLIPTLLVPTWLSIILGIPYMVLAISIGVGQIIPGLIGVLIMGYAERFIIISGRSI